MRRQYASLTGHRGMDFKQINRAMCAGSYEEPLPPSTVCTAEGLTGVDVWNGDVRHWHLHKGLDCILLRVQKGWVPGLPPAIWGECEMVGDWVGARCHSVLEGHSPGSS